MNRVIVSASRNPALNLAIETALFHQLGPQDHVMFLYVNNPCVVIGRNQNPWKECNLAAAASANVPVIRRRSGGGTVVHDLGNVNFCVQVPRDEFSRSSHLHMILDSLPLKNQNRLRVNSRNDIVTVPENSKVSGSSYKIERGGSYHHATMLLHSNLDMIRSLLRRTEEQGAIVEARGTDSVPSPVSNVGWLGVNEFLSICVAGFKRLYPDVREESVHVTPEIVADARTLLSWEWSFGQTLRFTHKIGPAEFTVHKGKIEESNFPGVIGQEYRNLKNCSRDIRLAVEPWALQNP